MHYPFVVLGGLAAVLGAVLGDYLSGPAPLPPDWVQVGSVADWANRLLGHPFGVLAGSGVAVALTSVFAAWRKPFGVPAFHEPWMAWPLFVLVYLAYFDWLVAISLVSGVLCLGYFGAVLFRLLALFAGGRNVADAGDDPEEWPVYTILVPLYKEIAVASKFSSRCLTLTTRGNSWMSKFCLRLMIQKHSRR